MAPYLEKDVEAQSMRSVCPEVTRTSAEEYAESTQSVRPGLNETDSPESNTTPLTGYAESARSGRSEPSHASLGQDERLFQFVDELRREIPRPAEPWFLEMTTLRRFNFIHINNKLAECKKKLFETRIATDDAIIQLRGLLHDQGTGPL